MKSILIHATCALVLCGAAARGAGATAGDYLELARHAPTPEQRLELLGRGLALNPNHVPALLLRASTHLELGNDEPALGDSARAAELVPDDFDVNVQAGALAEKHKKYELAARFMARAVVLDARDPRPRVSLVQALVKLRRADKAIAHADYLVERYPHVDFPYSVRAEACEWAGRYDDSISDLTTLIERHQGDRQYVAYYMRRSSCYRAVGDGRKALEDAETVLRLDGQDPYNYAARGCAYEELGELQKAFDDYQSAADLRDDEEYHKIWCCLILRKLGRREEADKFIRDYLKESAEQFKQGQWIHPVLKYLAGEMTEDKVFELARNEDPETNREQLCEAYYYVGACHLAAGDLDKAEDLFNECLDQQVNNFYEHGFAIRDLRTTDKLRKEAAAADEKEGDRDEGKRE